MDLCALGIFEPWVFGEKEAAILVKHCLGSVPEVHLSCLSVLPLSQGAHGPLGCGRVEGKQA